MYSTLSILEFVPYSTLSLFHTLTYRAGEKRSNQWALLALVTDDARM